MRKFIVYMHDMRDIFKVAVPAKSEKAARDFVQGNGEIIKIKDVTEEWPISLDKISLALKRAEFGEIEIQFITRCLQENNIAE